MILVNETPSRVVYRHGDVYFQFYKDTARCEKIWSGDWQENLRQRSDFEPAVTRMERLLHKVWHGDLWDSISKDYRVLEV